MNFKDYYLEESSKFVKAMKYMRGLKPIGKGLAILTTDNPMGKSANSAINKENFQELEAMLKKMGKTYFKQKGHYGGIENSVIIINISKKEADKIANDDRWPQDSYIWAEPASNGMVYSIIKRGKKVSTQTITTGSSVQDYQDYFSEIRGRKFVIGFVIPDSFWAD